MSEFEAESDDISGSDDAYKPDIVPVSDDASMTKGPHTSNGPLVTLGANLSGMVLVPTNAIETAATEILHKHKHQEFNSILTCFDCRGLGGTTAIREAARQCNFMHVLVDVAKCAGLMQQKAKCIEHIRTMEEKHRLDAEGKHRLEEFSMEKFNVKHELERVLVLGMAALVRDCLAAIKLGFDPTATRIVYDHVVPSPPPLRSGGATRLDLISPIITEITNYVFQVEKDTGKPSGLLIQIANAHEIFPKDCMPYGEPSRVRGTVPTSRIGALMLQTAADCLEYAYRNAKIAWAFTGTRKDASTSFGWYKIRAEDLSEDLKYFSACDVVTALSNHVPGHMLSDPRLAPCWSRLSGPPIVTRFFLDAARSLVNVRGSEISSVEALLSSWDEIEKSVVNMIDDMCRIEGFDSEAAKFCALVSWLTRNDLSMEGIHSSIWNVSASGLLRMGVRSNYGSPKAYFDEPYPLLLALFAAKYGLPKHTVNYIKRKSAAGIVLAFELYRLFEGSAGDCLRSSLGLNRFLLERSEDSKGKSEDSKGNKGRSTASGSGSTVKMETVGSLSQVQFDGKSIFIVDKDEALRGCQLALEAEDTNGAKVRLLISISLTDHDEWDAMGALYELAGIGAAYWARDKVRTLCVFASPFFKSGMQTNMRSWSEIMSRVTRCSSCKSSAHGVPECAACSASRSGCVELLKQIHLHQNSSSGSMCSSGGIQPMGESEGVESFYFGQDHEFWSSCPLNQILSSKDNSAHSQHTTYVLSLLNLRHITDLFRDPSDKKLLFFDSRDTLCSVSPDSRVPQFPAMTTWRNLHYLYTYMRTFLDGKPSVILCACIDLHSLSCLSLLDPKLLNEALKLGLTSSDLNEVDKFTALYRTYAQDLPDPSTTSCDVDSIAQCLEAWGSNTSSRRFYDLKVIKEYLTRLQKEKGVTLQELRLEHMMDDREVERLPEESCKRIPLGIKLAVLNVLSSINSGSRKRKAVTEQTAETKHLKQSE